MRETWLISTVSMLVLLAGCTVLQRDHIQFDGLSNCPEHTPIMLLVRQSQFSPLSDTHTLACALSVLRITQDPTVLRTSLGSRISLYLAERETSQEKRERLAAEGFGFAETALANGGDGDGAVHYYLATNLGLAIREQITLAIKNLSRLENEMKRAMDLSPDIDDGGPLRILGALYLKAPAWPNGIGDHDKAQELLEKVVKQYPEHPLNHLFYAQVLWDDGDKALLPKIKAEFDLGEKLLAEGNWGYSKQSWKKEFDEFRQEIN